MNKKYNYFLFQLHSYKKLNGTNKARVLYMKKNIFRTGRRDISTFLVLLLLSFLLFCIRLF